LKALAHSLNQSLSLSSSDSPVIIALKQVLLFGFRQGLSCIFPLVIFISLAASTMIDTGIPRYDTLLIICIAAQLFMFFGGLETRDEVLVITLFHALGLIMEIHKVHRGSWSYPEEAYTKFFGVPLYAGFMYASVGSYICQAWRNLALQVHHWPVPLLSMVAGAAIYLNFFTNAFIPDLRWIIVLFVMIVFFKTRFSFVLNQRTYYMPAVLSFILVGLFIWLGENIATFYGAWKYAHQHTGWQMVRWHKISSWSLLVIVSIIIVGELKRIKLKRSSSACQ
jgi:uncharacterized membrane protein YoaT (DUF817 family)